MFDPASNLLKSQLDLVEGYFRSSDGRSHVWLTIKEKYSHPTHWMLFPKEMLVKFVTPSVIGKVHYPENSENKFIQMEKGQEVTIPAGTPFYFEANSNEKFTVILYCNEELNLSSVLLIPIE